MTRYEAAALLNACLDRVTETTDELRRLLKEFETELAILRGRVDGLEARVGELEATQFSTTTKLKGTTHWVLGAAKYHGKGSSQQAAANGGTSFSYDLRLGLETSFTGKDLLYTRLHSGNMDNIFGAKGVGLFGQEYGVQLRQRSRQSRPLCSIASPSETSSPLLVVPSFVWTTCCRYGLAPIRQT